MRITDIFRFKLFESQDRADLEVVNENFQIVEESLAGQIAAQNEVMTIHKSSEDHDGRYYTEAEVNNLLNGKANNSHSHTWNAIAERPDNFKPSVHIHDDRYNTKTEINNKLNEIGVITYHTGQMSCVGTSAGGSGEASTYISVSNGKYIAVVDIEAWVGQNTIVQCTCDGNDWGRFMKAYQSGRNCMQIFGIADVKDSAFHIWLSHNDSSLEVRAFNWAAHLMKIN